jgi:hypothetical protein
MQPLSQRLKYNSMLQMKRLKNKKQTSKAVFEISLHHVKYQECQLFFFYRAGLHHFPKANYPCYSPAGAWFNNR